MNNNIQEAINTNHKIETEEEEVGKEVVRLANAVAFPMVLKSALELGVIDTIQAAGEGIFLSPSEIVHRLPTKPSNPDAPLLLDRMLFVLASHKVLRCHPGSTERLYGAGPVCKFLGRNGGLGSVAPMFLVFHDEVFIETWYRLKDVILEGGSAFNRAHGKTLFEYTSTNQRFNKLFNDAMSNFTTMIMKKVLEVYHGFEGVKVLVDVGGGIGTNLGLVSSKYPEIKCINFDLPSVVADAPFFPGVEHVGGDMFADVPKGDTIFMKFILHDWNDHDCLKILKNCWSALPCDGKVIIVETILPTEPGSNGDDTYSSIACDMDVTMLAQCSGGKERTRKEFEELAIDSGFFGCRFVCSAYHCWVLEFHK